MDVNEHERLSNITLKHKFKERNNTFTAVLSYSHNMSWIISMQTGVYEPGVKDAHIPSFWKDKRAKLSFCPLPFFGKNFEKAELLAWMQKQMVNAKRYKEDTLWKKLKWPFYLFFILFYFLLFYFPCQFWKLVLSINISRFFGQVTCNVPNTIDSDQLIFWAHKNRLTSPFL